RPAPIPVVVNEKVAADGDEVAEEVDERVPTHLWIIIEPRRRARRAPTRASTMTTPPGLAVGALYDRMLQSALRQFFDRATLDAEPTRSVATDARLAIEPSA